MDLMQFFDMILHVDKTLGMLLAQYGVYVYAVLFAILFCENGLVVLFFFPGDTLLFIAGAFCATGEMNYPLLMALLMLLLILLLMLAFVSLLAAVLAGMALCGVVPAGAA